MKTVRTLTLAAIAATLLFQTSITLTAAKAPLRIAFQKCFVEDRGPFGGHYAGTVDGDLGSGTVNFTFASLVPGAVVWQFSGVYTITTQNYTVIAYADGIDNLQSTPGHDLNVFGHDVLNGMVIGGSHLGARVHVSAQDVEKGTCSEGTITITPSNER